MFLQMSSHDDGDVLEEKIFEDDLISELCNKPLECDSVLPVLEDSVFSVPSVVLEGEKAVCAPNRTNV